ncbi:hypothetical protein G5C51_33315 [Streptomyces sp. A7024]|uniref:Integral membrane protein n=1 Tax=Streptomyces coryli TaxID=1128680 RepID=A0A6G4UBJ9_9ACTN|nr:hypothetical protein [Streptomyces coryli]
MSDKQQPDAGDGAPQPEPVKFFGTTWVDRGGAYWGRRVGVGIGSLVLAGAGAYVLRLAYEGLALSNSGSLLSILMVVAFAVCSSLAFSRMMTRFQRRPEAVADAKGGSEASMRPIYGIGFVGVLLAYFFRNLVEAPGEKLHRAEYERELEIYERRRTTRTGNPAKRKRQRKRG